MAFKTGDKVKVIGSKSADNDFICLEVGTVALIANIWDGEEFNVELDGYSEQVREDEIELTEEDLTDNDFND
jgi:hypothetical protein